MDKKVFLKALVHPAELSVREDGMALCEKWIPTGNHDAMDWLAVWKGLHFCMWHSDKPFVQHALAHRLSNMQNLCPNNEQWFLMMSGFWDTMAREWSVEWVR